MRFVQEEGENCFKLNTVRTAFQEFCLEIIVMFVFHWIVIKAEIVYLQSAFFLHES